MSDPNPLLPDTPRSRANGGGEGGGASQPSSPHAGPSQRTPRLTPSVSGLPSACPSPLRPRSRNEGHGLSSDVSPPPAGSIVVISGGSGYNDLVGATPDAVFVMPISDNGGSSSEIIRVLGGPSIGDIRSRLVRLIPTSRQGGRRRSGSAMGSSDARDDGYQPPASNDAMHALLSYRLPAHLPTRQVKQEWLDILEGRHRLWTGIEPERKEVIRGFLVHFEAEVLRRAQRNFNFKGGSIGNFFLSSAQKFFRSIQSAIFLFTSVTHIHPSTSGKVLPAINTNHTATIAAELQDGEIIVGQCQISHPALPRVRSSKGSSSAGQTTALSTQPPGTPSSAIFDPFSSAAPIVATGESTDAEEMARRATLTPSRQAQLIVQRGESLSKVTVGSWGDGLEPASGDEDEGSDEDEEEDDDEGDDLAHDSRGGRDGGWGGAVMGVEENAYWRPRVELPKGGSNIFFSKEADEQHEPLRSPIHRIFYVNAYGTEIYPAPNRDFISSLHSASTLIYSCGSLWTSIVPCLNLRGVGSAIKQSRGMRWKVMLLNTSWDRETTGLDAVDFIRIIHRSLSESDEPRKSRRPSSSLHSHHHQGGLGPSWAGTATADSHAEARGEDSTRLSSSFRPNDFITHLLYFASGRVGVDEAELTRMGIRGVRLDDVVQEGGGGGGSGEAKARFTEEAVREGLRRVWQDV